MAVGGDIIELVHEQDYLGQALNNVYYFEVVPAEALLGPLAAWFETNVVPAVKAIQNNEVNHLNLRLRNIFNDGETYEEPLTGTGSTSAGLVQLPAFIAAQIRLEHVQGGIRPGFKRWGGLTEATIESGLIAAGVVTLMDTLGGLLVNPPSVANADYAHVIVGRVCDIPNPVAGESPACLSPYRLPISQAEADIGYPVSYAVYTQPTSQNSRKWYT